MISAFLSATLDLISCFRSIFPRLAGVVNTRLFCIVEALLSMPALLPH
jgi:hypothetical protein